MQAFQIRRYSPNDSLDAMTVLLHSAFVPLADLGLNCSCVDQSVQSTRRRISKGDCFVATVGQHVVGTVTLHESDAGSAVPCYRLPSVASLHQFAVDPAHQHAGIGSALLRTAESWALTRRYSVLALDTPEPARHLHAYYAHHGYQRKEALQFAGKTYRSVVFGKPLFRTPARASAGPVWPARHPAEMLLLARGAHEAAARTRPTGTGAQRIVPVGG